MDRAEPWRLHYTRTQHKDDVDFRVRLTTTPLPWGGVRWWFVCPLTVNGRSCQRRCAKLYLPPGGRYYGCRLCYALTCASVQEAHRFDNMYRMLAAEADKGIFLAFQHRTRQKPMRHMANRDVPVFVF